MRIVGMNLCRLRKRNGRHVQPATTSSGEPRKASQRNTRRGARITVRITPTWRAGDNVQWQGRDGVYRRDVGDGKHAEIAIGERILPGARQRAWLIAAAENRYSSATSTQNSGGSRRQPLLRYPDLGLDEYRSPL